MKNDKKQKNHNNDSSASSDRESYDNNQKETGIKFYLSDENTSDGQATPSTSTGKKYEEVSYLDIFTRPSFNTTQKKPNSDSIIIKDESGKKEYDYPVNIFKHFLFTWTHKVLTAANKKPQLEISDLGTFSPDYMPEKFLAEIKKTWDYVSKKTNNLPLIKSLFLENYCNFILIFLGNIFVCGMETLNVLLYRSVILYLDKDPQTSPLFSLSNSIILLLVNKFFYNFLFRLYETTTITLSYKLMVQLDALIYDKLLRTSIYANVSEGSLVNFIQIDCESFGEYFTYSPATLVLPIQIVFFLYLLFSYFGYAFFFGLLSLILITLLSFYFQSLRNNAQDLLFEKKERRMKTTTQAFEIIKVVKLYSWENYFTNKIKKEREEELKSLKTMQIYSLLIKCLFWSTSPIMSFVSICSYKWIYGDINLSNLLTSLFIFHTLSDPLSLLPEYLIGLATSMISLKRIEIFLNKKECNPDQIIHKYETDNDELAVEIDNLDFGIIKKNQEFQTDEDEENENNQNIELQEIKNDNEKKENLLVNKEKNDENKEEEIITLLENIDLKIEKGQLIGIVGKVGSGKTSLLNAILNNLDILNNPTNKKIKINGSISYVPQKAWILADTVRENILFRKKYDETKYKKAVELSRLDVDFELLKAGDMTQVSDNGDNLSGGQKARINIARAVYNDSDIYLFDDPFSALDAFVSKTIFENLILDYLKGKTILLVTHSIQFIPFMNKVILLNEGKINFFGNAEDAMKLDFYKDNFSGKVEKKNEEKKEKEKYISNKVLSEMENTEQEDTLITLKKIIKKPGRRRSKIESKFAYKKLSKFQSFSIIFSYCGGCCFLIGILLFFLILVICDSSSNYAIAEWSDKSNAEIDINTIDYNINTNNDKYFYYYLITKLLGIILIFIKSYVVVLGLIAFNKKMYNSLLHKLMRAPINLFHDIVAKSHIFNRFSKDMENSTKFFDSFDYGLSFLFNLITAIGFTIIFYWKSIFIIPILIILEYYLYRYYAKCAKDLFVLESFSRLPILSGFSETLSGLSSVRAYDYEKIFQKIYHQKLHDLYRVLKYQNGTLSWFALNVDLIGFLLLFFVLVCAWFLRDSVNTTLLGVLLNYVLQFVEKNFYFFDKFNINERMAHSLESCEAYTHIVQEAPLEKPMDEKLRKKKFPQTGNIEFINYSVKYRPDTKIVLNNLNIKIISGQKIGVVGRTGSGKSTLCLCLFRILEPTTGKILIDNIDISLIGLSLLREIITVIPQDPTLIEGTLRENLDPASKFNDDEILFQVNLIGLAYLIEDKGLEFEIKEGGTNLSAGEKQLICMVRAILRKSKIIIMDEATSSVDYGTESLIQKTVINGLKGSTIITIAHRIKTIINYDRIFVFDKGYLIEDDTPKNLIDKKGAFYNLYIKAQI